MINEPFPLVTCSGCYGVHPYGQCPNQYYYPLSYPSYPFRWYTTTESVKEEKVDKTPEHYDMPITPIDFILKNNLGFAEGCVIKYVSRYKKKGTPIEDLKKARHYLDILIAGLEKS